MVVASVRAKARGFGASDGGAYGCRFLIEDVVVGLALVPEFQVKTFVWLDSTTVTLCVVTLLGALLWS